MSSKQTPFTFRTIVSLAALSAGVLTFAPLAHAGLLGGATGTVGGAASPRGLDLNGQGRANIARDGAPLPRGEKLRDATGNALKSTTDKAQQLQGAATGAAQAGGATAIEKTGEVKSGVGNAAPSAGGVDTNAAGSVTKDAATGSGSAATRNATASGSASARREGRGVNASVSGDAGASRAANR